MRSLSPAARIRSEARSNCSWEIVTVVTRHPNSRAAWMANPPQPLPISRTRLSAVIPANSHMRWYLLACASASGWPSYAKTALE